MSCLEEYNTVDAFISSIKKVSNSRKHKIKNSIGVYDAYKYYRKNKPKEHLYVLSESLYFSIIRKTNNLLADLLVAGYDINLPCKMGKLELRKYEPVLKLVNGKLKTNLPIDWDRTLKLWYEDKEALNNKTLIRLEEKEIFKVYYNKIRADYNNKSFYQFNINRELKKRLKNNIKKGKIDAFLL